MYPLFFSKLFSRYYKGATEFKEINRLSRKERVEQRVVIEVFK